MGSTHEAPYLQQIFVIALVGGALGFTQRATDALGVGFLVSGMALGTVAFLSVFMVRWGTRLRGISGASRWGAIRFGVTLGQLGAAMIFSDEGSFIPYVAAAICAVVTLIAARWECKQADSDDAAE
jgi:hypothetical protein